MTIEESNIYNQLDAEARANGKNLTEICKTLGLSRSSLQGWKNDEPKTIKIIRAIKKEISKVDDKAS